LPAHPKLDHHEIGALQGSIAIPGERQDPVITRLGQHPSRQPAHDLQALGIDVEEDEIVEGHAVRASDEPLHQLGRVRARPTDHRDLHTHRAASYTPTDEIVRKLS
jgi:hypothetical protein